MNDSAPSADTASWVRLALTPRVGPVQAHRLLRHFGSPDRIFEAAADGWSAIEGIRKASLEALRDRATAEAAAREIESAEKLGIRIVSFADADYPALLRHLAAPPLILYVRGGLTESDGLALSVVGPRKPSEYSRIMTMKLLPPLCACGLTIVSGLAYGVDAEAHRAAVDCEGRTLAVLGHGLGVAVYPSANQKLAHKIVQEGRGALLSIFPIDQQPDPHLYPQRNEIIAALGLGTLIVEAGAKSGALITATFAAELGRTVMACPGDATRPSAQGSNRLIADGAVLIQRSDDVLEALAGDLRTARGQLDEAQKGADDGDETSEDASDALNRQAQGSIVGAPADPLEKCILDLLADEHRPLDFILEGCAREGHSLGAVVQKLLMMDLAGRLRQLPGRIYARIR